MISNTCLCCIEKCKEFTRCTFLLLFLLVLLWFTLFISVWISLLSLLIIICFNYWDFAYLCLHTKISWLFFIPKYLNWNFLLAKIIACECVILCIKNMENMTNSWARVWCFVRNNTNFLTICINWTTFDMSNKPFWILKSSWLTNLFNISSNIKNSDIRRLSPNNKEITKNINSNNFTLALREI